MKKETMPFAIIAILGIVAVIIISVVGLNNRAEIAEGGDAADTEQVEEGATTDVDADSVYQANCAMCHGADLASGSAPDLTTIGGSLSVEEITEIIQNGTDGGMPAITAVQGAELEALASWLSEKQ